MKSVSSGYISSPREHDVLFGRGSGLAMFHPGNLQYRSLVEEYREEYTAATHKTKKYVAENMFKWITGLGGRFLKRMDSASDEAEEVWVEVNRTVALEKIKQSLREKRKKLREGGSESRKRTSCGSQASPPELKRTLLEMTPPSGSPSRSHESEMEVTATTNEKTHSDTPRSASGDDRNLGMVTQTKYPNTEFLRVPSLWLMHSLLKSTSCSPPGLSLHQRPMSTVTLRQEALFQKALARQLPDEHGL